MAGKSGTESSRSSRAQRIANQIVRSERYANTRAFEDRIYGDEPILRTGAQAFRDRPRTGARQERSHEAAHTVPLSHGSEPQASVPRTWPPQAPTPRPATPRSPMPSRYRKMRALGRGRAGWGSSYAGGGSKLFFEQGKLMEDFEDDFKGTTGFNRYFPTYDEMSDYELRCYFSWRTLLRRAKAGEEPPEAPTSFLFVHAYELLCGIGVEPGLAGYGELKLFLRQYEGTSAAFSTHMRRWIHDYVVFHDLDPSLLVPLAGTFSLDSVALLRQAEAALLAQDDPGVWPDHKALGSPALPDPQRLLNALALLSRYRADRSRFFRDHREEVAIVCARVFARMVDHCRKRRKTGYVEGLFGAPTRTAYTMFPSALFWSPQVHPDVSYAAGDSESYVCEHGFWWRTYPCRRTYTSKELGTLLHAVDARMRVALSDAHPLKERPLPKYQAKFVDGEIAALVAQREAQEAARVTIDRASLRGIRSAAARTREALLTDDERAHDPLPGEVPPSMLAQPAPPDVTTRFGAPAPSDAAASQAHAPAAPNTPSGIDGLDSRQTQLLRELLGGAKPSGDALFVSLAVDAINEAFLDVVGDTVIEFDDNGPALVPDYEQDVRSALGG